MFLHLLFTLALITMTVVYNSLYLVETADKNEDITVSILQGAGIANKSLTNGEEKAQMAQDYYLNPHPPSGPL